MAWCIYGDEKINVFTHGVVLWGSRFGEKLLNEPPLLDSSQKGMLFLSLFLSKFKMAGEFSASYAA